MPAFAIDKYESLIGSEVPQLSGVHVRVEVPALRSDGVETRCKYCQHLRQIYLGQVTHYILY